MVYIIIGPVLALTFIWAVRVKREKSTRDLYLSRPRTLRSVVGVQIICGDCSGHELPPVKTYMDRRGTCETCGGKSYMLASRRGSEFNQRRGAALSDLPAIINPTGQEPAKSGRLLAFRTTAGRRHAN
jgi:hypothetical protein